ncbi:TetR/AcrR family transcriptional regulator [Kribbella sp. NPDC051620]|uniref:TetR/AcrR family transcriptional regulator n=1 Tax=Kribbella sp. NPDC051620 TaxID=3364120 RepID=UPI003792560A
MAQVRKTLPSASVGATVGRPSQRGQIIGAALDLLRRGDPVTLESAARAAGLSKPGLMYHFPTKEALVEAMVDHVLDGYERDFARYLTASSASPTPAERLFGYLSWAVEGSHDAADLVMMTDPRLREQMATRWADRLRAWTEVPGTLPIGTRARLHAVRLMADGCWFADASGVLPLTSPDREALLTVASELLGEV